MKYLGLIPARKNSKRVINKNMKIINGYPLIYWTIKSAKESELLDDIYISTDSPEIEGYAKGLGIKVIIRGEELSNDEASLTGVMNQALLITHAENIVLLRPTSPIREKGLIDECIKAHELFYADSLATGFINKELEWPYTNKKIDNPSHSVKGWFQNNGCVEIHKKEIIIKGELGIRNLKKLTPDNHKLEADSELDFKLIEYIMGEIDGRNK